MRRHNNFIEGKIECMKLHPNAQIPHKDTENSVGYNVTLVSRTDNRAEDDLAEVNNYGTGISIKPPSGYYFEMVASPTLYKNGYMLATGVSVVDEETQGELIVPLYKYKDCKNDLELPFTAVQLVLKKAERAHLKSVTTTVPVQQHGGYPGMYVQTQQPVNDGYRPVQSRRNHMF